MDDVTNLEILCNHILDSTVEFGQNKCHELLDALLNVSPGALCVARHVCFCARML